MNKIDFSVLAKQLMFSLSEQEIVTISEDFILFEQQLALLDEIYTDGVEEMIYPFEDETGFLREDVVDDVLPIEKVLMNASRVRGNLIVVPKVVK